jgi:hypothetical protein
VRNTSQAVVAHAVVTDDLAALLAAASIGALPGVTSLAGSTLTWRVPTLQPGEEAVLTYTAVVGGDSYNLDIVSPATPGVGGSCPVVCTTELLTTPAAVDPTHDDGGHHGGGGTSGDSSLAYTGGDLGALGVGVVFLCAGAGILVVSRRRRTGEE